MGEPLNGAVFHVGSEQKKGDRKMRDNLITRIKGIPVKLRWQVSMFLLLLMAPMLMVPVTQAGAASDPVGVTAITGQGTDLSLTGDVHLYGGPDTVAPLSPDSVNAAVQQYKLTVKCTGTSLVNAVNPQGCGVAKSYDKNKIVTLKPNLTLGLKFIGWSGGGCSGTGNCVVTMNAPKTVTATFHKVMYDFVANADKATVGWSNGFDEHLTFGGSLVDERGFAVWWDANTYVLEDGTSGPKVLETHPQWIDNGEIKGIYRLLFSGYKVQAGDRFHADVGLLAGSGGQVKFVVDLFPPVSGAQGMEVYDSNDGMLKTIDVALDLEELTAGEPLDTVYLRVLAQGLTDNGSSAQDWAVWKNAYIYRP